MPTFDRRNALVLGLAAAAAVPVGLRPIQAKAAMYGSDSGEELAPGVRLIKLTEKPSYVKGYKIISMRDAMWAPGAKTSNPSMPNDMVCHTIEGELYIDNGGGDEFMAPAGQVWSCAKGQMEAVENRTDAPAVMRIIDLIEG